MNSLSQLKYPNDLSQFGPNMQNMQGMNFLGGMNNPLAGMGGSMGGNMGGNMPSMGNNPNMSGPMSGMGSSMGNSMGNSMGLNSMGLGGVSSLQGLQNLSGLAGLSGMGASMMGSNPWNNADGMLGNQVTLNNLINQNRSA
jgi:hypothetical protein